MTVTAHGQLWSACSTLAAAIETAKRNATRLQQAHSVIIAVKNGSPVFAAVLSTGYAEWFKLDPALAEQYTLVANVDIKGAVTFDPRFASLT